MIVARRSSNRGNGDVLSANLPAFLLEAEPQDLVRQSALLLRLNMADVCEGWRFAEKIIPWPFLGNATFFMQLSLHNVAGSIRTLPSFLGNITSLQARLGEFGCQRRGAWDIVVQDTRSKTEVCFLPLPSST